MATKFKIKKGDRVKVITGRDPCGDTGTRRFAVLGEVNKDVGIQEIACHRRRSVRRGRS